MRDRVKEKEKEMEGGETRVKKILWREGTFGWSPKFYIHVFLFVDFTTLGTFIEF